MERDETTRIAAVRIAEEMEARGLNPRQLSLRAGFSAAFVSQFLAGKQRSITLDRLAAIAKVLGVPVIDLLVPPEQQELVRAAQNLLLAFEPEDRARILRMIEAYRPNE